MWPFDIAFNTRIADGVNVIATAGIKVKPIDTGLGNYFVVLIPDDHFGFAFNRVVLGIAGVYYSHAEIEMTIVLVSSFWKR